MPFATILTPAPVSTKQFHYDSAAREYVGEISSTNGFGRVYADACDEGLTLVSAKTGEQLTFVVDATIRDAEGDIEYWMLVPASTHGTHPLRVSIRLFND